MTLRGRLLLALAYVLLLAIVALEVPLALRLNDRVDSEVRSRPAPRPTSSRPASPATWGAPRSSTRPSRTRRRRSAGG